MPDFDDDALGDTWWLHPSQITAEHLQDMGLHGVVEACYEYEVDGDPVFARYCAAMEQRLGISLGVVENDASQAYDSLSVADRLAIWRECTAA